MPITITDRNLIEAAITGLEAKKQEIDEHLSKLRALLGQRRPGRRGAADPQPRKRGQLSAEGRARIAVAQRKRWAAARKKAKAE